MLIIQLPHKTLNLYFAYISERCKMHELRLQIPNFLFIHMVFVMNRLFLNSRYHVFEIG